MAAAKKDAPTQDAKSQQTDWWTKIEQCLIAERNEAWQRARDRNDGTPTWTMMFGHYFGGHLEYQYTRLADNLLGRCRSAPEKALLICLLAHWPSEVALRVELVESDGKKSVVRVAKRQHDEDWAEDGMPYWANLVVQREYDGHVLAIAVELKTHGQLDRGEDFPADVSLKCNFECGDRTDLPRDIELQNQGWLVHRLSTAEVADNPMKCAKESLKALIAELERRVEHDYLKRKQRVSRLTLVN